MNFRKYLYPLKDLFFLTLPRDKTEKALFFGFEVLFLVLGFFLALTSSVIDNQAIRFDIYFDFDNPRYLKELFRIREHIFLEAAHPLISVVLLPIEIICELVSTIFGMKAKTLVVIFFTSLSVSASILFVFKYLKDIIQLDVFRCLLLSMLFGFFANSLIISFTPESYSFSMALLTFVLYYFSISIKKNNKISDLNIFFLTISTGGITITNAIKVLIPVLFIKDLSLKQRVQKYALHMGLFVTIVVVFFILINLLTGSTAEPFYFVTKFKNAFFRFQENDRINDLYKLPYLKSAILYFWGAPLLFAELSTIPFYSENSSYPQLYILEYPHFWQYLTIAFLFVICFFSVIQNFKLKFVQILLLFFSVDVLIHLVLKWGLHNAVIYGGHWTFLVPLLMGWLYFSFKKEKWKNYLDIFFIVIFCAILVNNIFGMAKFIDFALTNYAI